MAPENTIKLLFITALCFAIDVSARIVPNSDEKPENRYHGMPAEHKTEYLKSVDHAHVDSNLKNICSKTDSPAFCLSSVSSFVKGRATVDAALDASIRAGTSYAKYVGDQIKTLGQKSRPEEASIYKDCSEFYQSAVDGFGEALKAHPAHDIGRMNSELSGVMTWISTCDDEFDEAGIASTLTVYAQKLRNFAGLSLSLVGQMK
ncbi:hypothetical protein M569_02251 [Genlisea aurea]|uniref:Pectinesterase inhibitor domain-containing protein n=1 Tax=Genlisea aurea TaxID=192259 RepID=S8CYJ6_9LAMI|nr:hypothetical protein M569_02251 [Genlisea aurea]